MSETILKFEVSKTNINEDGFYVDFKDVNCNPDVIIDSFACGLSNVLYAVTEDKKLNKYEIKDFIMKTVNERLDDVIHNDYETNISSDEGDKLS